MWRAEQRIGDVPGRDGNANDAFGDRRRRTAEREHLSQPQMPAPCEPAFDDDLAVPGDVSAGGEDVATGSGGQGALDHSVCEVSLVLNPDPVCLEPVRRYPDVRQRLDSREDDRERLL